MYEALLTEAEELCIEVQERSMRGRIKGLYGSGVIWINKKIETTDEKACILAEEIGHHHKTAGNILDQSTIENVKQERLARKWAWERLVPPEKLILAYKEGCQSRYETADFLRVTEDFLEQCIEHYRNKYGPMLAFNDRFTLYFDPLGVYERLV